MAGWTTGVWFLVEMLIFLFPCPDQHRDCARITYPLGTVPKAYDILGSMKEWKEGK
jgi:hypothetical protein